MSQKSNCELTHKRGARKKTCSVFIKPGLERDRAFFVSPSRSAATRRFFRKGPINKVDARVKTLNPNGRERASVATRSTENPEVHPLSFFHRLSKSSRFLNMKWRFGGGILPLKKPSTRCAPQFSRGFFYRYSRSIIPDQSSSPSEAPRDKQENPISIGEEDGKQ